MYASKFGVDESKMMERLWGADADGKTLDETCMYFMLMLFTGVVASFLNQRPGTPLYNIKAYLPVIESFGFSGQLRASTSGQAFPQRVFDHWDMMSSEPLEAGTQASTLVADIRRRKGLKQQMTPLSEYEDKL
ncbi:hypothetical protein POM88_042813 [Heracleum sosnowskyi]|uniref:Elongation factor EFG domain-containing protein n=1 Tax=Heracleum sosnowskyi TaxID=360622 RepID=A0AAD8HGY8_9APIA|nr:hypothetical protein POM88_042813 [Heracleum sosnowskyi]